MNLKWYQTLVDESYDFEFSGIVIPTWQKTKTKSMKLENIQVNRGTNVWHIV